MKLVAVLCIQKQIILSGSRTCTFTKHYQLLFLPGKQIAKKCIFCRSSVSNRKTDIDGPVIQKKWKSHICFMGKSLEAMTSVSLL